MNTVGDGWTQMMNSLTLNPAQGPVAAAVVNAVSEALGLRIRQLPLSPDNLLRAVHAAPSFASEAQQDD